MGYIGQPAHPEVRGVVENAIQRIHAIGKPAGVYCSTPDQVQAYQKMGASFFLIGADTMLLKQAAQNLVEQF